MGRQFETGDDDAAAKKGEEVISASAPRLRQAPAHSRDDSFARRRGVSGSAIAPADASEQKIPKGGVALAAGTYSEESKEEIQADDTTTEKTKVCSSDLDSATIHHSS